MLKCALVLFPVKPWGIKVAYNNLFLSTFPTKYIFGISSIILKDLRVHPHVSSYGTRPDKWGLNFQLPLRLPLTLDIKQVLYSLSGCYAVKPQCYNTVVATQRVHSQVSDCCNIQQTNFGKDKIIMHSSSWISRLYRIFITLK